MDPNRSHTFNPTTIFGGAESLECRQEPDAETSVFSEPVMIAAGWRRLMDLNPDSDQRGRPVGSS